MEIAIISRLIVPGSGEVLATDPNNLERRAASLSGDTSDDALTDALKEAEDGKGDVHLAQFLNIPGKDNGFDIEGLAAAADKVFVGLRGPVLRGWAVILELSFTIHHSLLQLENFTASDRPYRKHFLQLGGLGVRDLCVLGKTSWFAPDPRADGPTIYRWSNALREQVTVCTKINSGLLEIPFGSGTIMPKGGSVLRETCADAHCL